MQQKYKDTNPQRSPASATMVDAVYAVVNKSEKKGTKKKDIQE